MTDGTQSKGRHSRRYDVDRFVAHYLLTGDAGASARAAGHRGTSVRQRGYEYLQKPEVRQAIDEGRAALAAATASDAERVRLELARVGMAHLRDVVTWDGGGMSLRPSDELPEHVSAAVREVKVVRTVTTRPDGTSVEREEMSVKMHDKVEALTVLARVNGQIRPGSSTFVDNRDQSVHVDGGAGHLTAEQIVEGWRHVAGVLAAEQGDVIEGTWADA